MATFSVAKNRGLRTADNQITAVPDGAAALAENCVQYFRDTLEPRRGQPFLGYGFATSTDRLVGGGFFQGKLVGFRGTPESNSYTLFQDTGSAFSDFSGGPFGFVDAATARARFVEAASNLYFNTAGGLFVLDSLSDNPVLAGVPRALGSLTLDVLGLSNLDGNLGIAGWLAPNNQVAYRIVFGIRDANNNVKLGAPSGRIVVTNPADVVVQAGAAVRNANIVTVTVASGASGILLSDTVSRKSASADAGFADVTSLLIDQSAGLGSFSYSEAGANATSAQIETYSEGTRNVDVKFYLPAGLTTSHFLRIYRTFESGGASIAPNDECYLVFETPVTSVMISNGQYTYTDFTPSSFMGDPLYSNANTGDGIEQSNFRAPLGKDMCEWDNRLWLFNTKSKQRFSLALVGTGSGTGLQNNDTITIGGVTYTGKTSNPATLSRQFQIFTALTPSQNIALTAKALEGLINQDATNPVYAYYVSSNTSAPGQLQLEERGIGGAPFTVYASRPSAWSPSLTTSSSGAQTSLADVYPHSAYFSKDGEPDAFPVVNWEPVGSRNHNVLRAVPLLSQIFVFRDDDQGELWTISGAGGNYRADILDSTTKVLCPDSVLKMSNQIFAFTTQGVVACTSSGVRIVSKGIEDLLAPLMAPAMLPVVKQVGFAVAYESDRQYQLWLPTAVTDTVATQCFVYNPILDSWTHWTCSRSWGAVNPVSNLLTLGDGAAAQVRVERKSFTRSDYADEALPVTFVSATGKVVTLANVSGLSVGDMLYQDEQVRSVITAVTPASNTVTVNDTMTWTSPTQVLKSYSQSVTYCPVSGQAPSIVKHFRMASVHLSELQIQTPFLMTFDSERQPNQGTVPVPLPQFLPGFGQQAFGPFLLGSTGGVRNISGEVTMAHQQATQLRVGLTVKEARAAWRLNGFSVQYEGMSDRDQGGAT